MHSGCAVRVQAGSEAYTEVFSEAFAEARTEAYSEAGLASHFGRRWAWGRGTIDGTAHEIPHGTIDGTMHF